MKSNNQHLATPTSTVPQANLVAIGKALMDALAASSTPASPGVAYTGPLNAKRANGHAAKRSTSTSAKAHPNKGTRISVAQRHRISEGMKASWAKRRAEAEAQGKPIEVAAQIAPPAAPSKVSPKGPTLVRNMTEREEEIIGRMLMHSGLSVKAISVITGYTRAAIYGLRNRLGLKVHHADTRPDVRKAIRKASTPRSSKLEMTITPTTPAPAPAPVTETPAQVENMPALATA